MVFCLLKKGQVYKLFYANLQLYTNGYQNWPITYYKSIWVFCRHMYLNIELLLSGKMMWIWIKIGGCGALFWCLEFNLVRVVASLLWLSIWLFLLLCLYVDLGAVLCKVNGGSFCYGFKSWKHRFLLRVNFRIGYWSIYQIPGMVSLEL